MEHRKRHRTALLPKICIVVLLILAVPSLCLSQSPGETQEQGLISKMYNWLVYGPTRGPGYVDPNFANATADVIAGARDKRDPDMPWGTNVHIRSDGSMVGDDGVSVDPDWHPPGAYTIDDYIASQKKLEKEYDRPTPAIILKLRKKIAARRAKKALEAAQAAARQDKKAARAQAVKAVTENQSTGCFPRDMRILMADGTAKSVADVRAGDAVLTYDIGYDRVVSRPVLATYSVHSNHLYTINNGLQTTGGERVLTESGWRALNMLTQDDQVHSNGRMIDVDTIDYSRTELTTYNLQVDDTHNFYVQTESGDTYLVHNYGDGGK